ncbi:MULTISPECIES: ATPase, T2SS/T4P/T4SS family [Niallia]|nr:MULTISPECIES: ATPase, T2SS/T4P/T4SS family [Niallia]MDK8642457.1 ATPase, T2SS/T4P/T4SS family [Niallia taxi]MED4040565.1 ATPase, T2SS/T4P/T4SS family [Niallia taxi]MED4057005.1 ATPase, T2SS/T4P/T4SS family [Niallia taxi]MED4121649.1 ATPase, T2SS/T4P/T4SS family [Niallia taxi]UPO91298.1 CpaF/VirB11 family protein [Niallia sp. Man26]
MNLNSMEREIGIQKEFVISEWLADTISKNGLKQVVRINTYARTRSFKDICTKVRSQLQEIVIDGSIDKKTPNDITDIVEDNSNIWLERQHRAVIGDEQAMSYFITKINEVLHKENISSTDYPSFYNSLSEAIFHEVWGVSILHKWDKMPNSEAAVIRGTQLWIDVDGTFVKQEEEFESIERVERIKKAFTIRIKDAIINEQSPELEIEREDGSRITMIQKPRGKENYIMFRRFVVKNFGLEEQARLGTILEDDIPFFRSLSRVMANTIFAGRVRSAKSTFMKTMIKERDPSYVIGVLEKHFELNLSKEMNRLIFEIQAKEGDLHHAIPRLLRMEHDFIVVGEIRSLETEGYLQACERGERGAYSTYHLTTVEHVVPQITRHILDEFPNRNFENELERVARNIDIIVTMSADRDRRRKRVIGVTEIIWDEEKRRHRTQDLVRYSPTTNQYYYSSNISKELLALMAGESLEDAKILINHLARKAKESPMSDYELIKDQLLHDMLENSNG